MLTRNSITRPMIVRTLWEIVVTLGVVFLLTTLVLVISGAPPLQAYMVLFQGSLGSWVKFTQVIKVWIPLTLCGCGLLFTFRSGFGISA